VIGVSLPASRMSHFIVISIFYYHHTTPATPFLLENATSEASGFLVSNIIQKRPFGSHWLHPYEGRRIRFLRPVIMISRASSDLTGEVYINNCLLLL